MNHPLQKLNDLSRCAEVGLTAAAHLFGLPADYSPETFFEDVLAAAKPVILAPPRHGGPPLRERAFAPLEPVEAAARSRATYCRQEAVFEILRGHKRPDYLGSLIEDGTALSPALLTHWLDALSQKSLREYAVRALCLMGPAVLPAVKARYAQPNAPKTALLRLLLTLSDDDALAALLPDLEEILAKQDFAALTEIIPALTEQPKPVFYSFFAKLLPILICRPDSHVFLVGACLDAMAAYETPESTAFLEEMLTLCEHQILMERHCS